MTATRNAGAVVVCKVDVNGKNENAHKAGWPAQLTEYRPREQLFLTLQRPLKPVVISNNLSEITPGGRPSLLGFTVFIGVYCLYCLQSLAKTPNEKEEYERRTCRTVNWKRPCIIPRVIL